MHKYDCHDLSELAHRYQGELQPVLGIVPSLEGGAVPVPSAAEEEATAVL